MELSHDSMDEMLVDGYPEPGSYVRPINYNVALKEEIDEIINRAFSCEQYIKYTCFQSKLLTDAGQRSLDYYYYCGAWWLIGRVDTCHGFESHSSCHFWTLGKFFTRSCLRRFGVKLRHSIRTVSGAPLSSSGLEEAL